MGRNFLFLGLLIWAANSMAETKIVHETVADSDAYKVEKPVAEKEGRSVAGIKKKKHAEKSKTDQSESEPDSEVRYWQYQE